MSRRPRHFLPPGPFPPQDPPEPDTECDVDVGNFDGPEPETEMVALAEEVDLGAVFRDRLFTGHHLDGPARRALQSRLGQALNAGQLELGADLLSAWADTWSLSAMVDDANDAWSEAPDGPALGVLVRAAEVVRLALGWETTPDGPWPWPDEASIRQAVGAVDPSQDVVIKRHPADGAERLAGVLGLSVVEGTPLELPAHRVIDPALLPSLRAELGAALADGSLAAVAFTGTPDATPAAALALGELYLEGGRAQEAVASCGLAGLLAPEVPGWSTLRSAAPSEDGAVDANTVLDAACEGALVPGPPGRIRRGQVDTVGALLWVGPHPPVWVAPVAVHVLRALDGQRSLGVLEAAMQAPPGALVEVAQELVRVGAALRV